MSHDVQSLKVLIYGEPYDWAMAKNIFDSLIKLGHTPTIFDFTRFLYRTKSPSLKNRIFDRLFFERVSNNINFALENEVKNNNYDILLVLKGVHIKAKTILNIKKKIKIIANWNPDDFFNPLNSNNNIIECFDKYDLIFSPRPHLFDEYRSRGAKRIQLLDWYYLPEVQHPLHTTEGIAREYTQDVSFIGTWSPRRERLLSSIGDFNLAVWGAQWDKATSLFRKTIKINPPIYGREMARLIEKSKININILTIENKDTTNVRNFEIPACGGFQLAEHSNRVSEIFQEDIEISTFNSELELKYKVEYFLNREDKRNTIINNGFQKIANGHHAILDRVSTLIDVVTKR